MIEEISPKELKEKYYELLIDQEATNMLLISNLNEELEYLPEGNFYALIREGEEILYFVCNHLPFNCLVLPAHRIIDFDEKEYGREFASYVMKERKKVNGLQSSDDFIEGFEEAYPKKMKLYLAMDIMECREAVEFPLKGIVRKAVPEDTELLIGFVRQFAKEALHEAISDEEILERLGKMFSRETSDIFLYEVDEQPIGMVVSNRKMPHGRSISYVYVKEEERKKGYAKQMVSKVTSDYLKDNDYVALYVDRSNPFSNAAYQAVGYEYLHHLTNKNIE